MSEFTNQVRIVTALREQHGNVWKNPALCQRDDDTPAADRGLVGSDFRERKQ
jgi:hypothetical protein